ncbi:MAG: PLP-dependent aminotransferase family protein [Lachnospiraceae bacterium]|nr:PLP-dependent aminotransferase family protein [Lachnospiraceae bacterium]
MNELTIPLNTSGGSHLYEQIYAYIRSEILEGRLTPGEKLPSSRLLAGHLQVSRSTVNLAYEQLLAEGYLEAVPCKGFFIGKMDELIKPGKPLPASPPDNRDKEEFRWDFTPNGIDMRAFPYRTWRQITKEVLQDDRQELFALGLPQGDEALRQAISRYLFGARGVICRPAQIVVGAGNDYLLMLLRLLLKENSTIAFENPTYTKAHNIMRSLGFSTAIVAMDENGMEVESLEKSGADIAYIMPSHQFPTGRVTSVGRRNELLKWAAEKPERYLIEDDYDSEFRYRGKPIPALQGMDGKGRVIYMGTFSKAIAPAIRVSFMVLPPTLLEEYKKRAGLFSSTVSRIDQKILEEFINRGGFERHLNRMRKIYKGKHDLLLECLRPFKKRFTLYGDQAGTHVLLEARDKVTEEELKKTAAREGIKIYCLSDYILEKKLKEYPPTVILGYAGMEAEEIVSGIDCLARLWLDIS